MLDVYDHVRKYWEVIDRHSLKNFLDVTVYKQKADEYLLDYHLNKQVNLDDIIPDIVDRMVLRYEVERRLNI